MKVWYQCANFELQHSPNQSVSTSPPQGQLIDVTSEGNPELPGKNILPGKPRVLTLNDLSALNAHLRCVAQKWQTLGLQLGFTTEMLATLVPTSDGSCDPAINLSKVLYTWLQHTNPPATLEALCRALSHATVGEEKVGEFLFGRFIPVIFKSDITFCFFTYITATVRAIQTASTEENKLTGENAVFVIDTQNNVVL